MCVLSFICNELLEYYYDILTPKRTASIVAHTVCMCARCPFVCFVCLHTHRKMRGPILSAKRMKFFGGIPSKKKWGSSVVIGQFTLFSGFFIIEKKKFNFAKLAANRECGDHLFHTNDENNHSFACEYRLLCIVNVGLCVCVGTSKHL